MKGKRYIIGGLIACLALGYLVYVLLGSTMAYYSTVSELIGQGESAYDKGVRVKGEVVPGSIESSTENPVLIFIITDGEESLDVVYEGKAADIPDVFGDQTDVVLEGKLDSSETFHASSILTKCPSKYEGNSNE
jgi:cytochrome c-type biogenesis protein CcmE